MVNKLASCTIEFEQVVCRLDKYMSTSYAAVALPMAAALASIVAAVEYASPWKTEVITTSTSNVLTTASWSPILSGMYIVFPIANVTVVLTRCCGWSSTNSTSIINR